MKNSINAGSAGFASRLITSWRRLPLALRVLFACILMQACKADEPPVRGQLMVVLQTDMSLPKDVTKVKIQIKRDGQLYHDKDYVIAPGQKWIAKLPGTLAVVASVDNPTPRVEVIVIGLRNTEARVFAKSVTTIPENRTATLFVPIQWLCEGFVRVLPGEAGVESSCSESGGKERACRAGACELVTVDESTLDDYDEEDVFGGAEQGSKAGQCFDTAACFGAGFSVAPNEDCIVELAVPEGYGLNFGLLNPENEDGIEFTKGPREGDRLVPLDKSRLFGWDYVKGTNAKSTPVRVQLPKGVCSRLEDREFEAVVASLSCESKTLTYPTCGPWTDLEVVGEVEVDPPQPSGDVAPSAPDAGPEGDAAPEIESLTITLPNDEPIQLGVPVTLELLATPAGGGEPVDVADIAEWSSDDESVATVQGGVVTGQSTGKATITAKFGGRTAEFEVEVERGTPESIEFSNAPSDPIPAGTEHGLTATATYANGVEEDVSELAEWSSSDESIATVEDGVITGVAPGEVTITAVFDGVETEITIEIGEGVFETFAFSQVNLDTNVFQIVVKAVLTDSDGPNDPDLEDITDEVTWEQTAGEEFGVVDEDTGIVTVTNPGLVVVRVTYGTYTLPLQITVTFNGRDGG